MELFTLEAYVPTPQLTQLAEAVAAEAVLNVPVEHAVHTDKPVEAPYRPGKQMSHRLSTWPTPELNVPRPQLIHIAAAEAPKEVEYVPLAQAEQEVKEEEPPYVPAGQLTQGATAVLPTAVP